MNSRNEWPASCGVCGCSVRPGEGIVDTSAAGLAYRVLCPDDAPGGSLDPPKAPEASTLPSIHIGEERFER
jgi:hypothetical protein